MTASPRRRRAEDLFGEQVIRDTRGARLSHPGLPRGLWSMGPHLLVRPSGDPPPSPIPGTESPECAARGAPPPSLQGKIAGVLASNGLQGLGRILSPHHSNFFGSMGFSLFASIPPRPRQFLSTLTSFSEWIPGPFPPLQSHLWSVLCHLPPFFFFFFLAEQSLPLSSF